MSSLPLGAYEQVIDLLLEARILSAETEGRTVDRRPLEPAESHIHLARHLEKLLRVSLKQAGSPSEETLQRQVDLCNDVIALLRDRGRLQHLDQHAVSQPGQQLLQVSPGSPLSAVNCLLSASSPRPLTPLSDRSLFTGPAGEPSLASELQRELASADEVCILVSFIKWSGLRLLVEELRRFTARDGTRLRVITTSYMGATDFKAVEFLAQLPRCEVKVSYDTKITRLHAKVFAFHRLSGFSTAYVGSSNISNPAMTEGLEWNLKVSRLDSPHIMDKVFATFEAYWEDRGFRSFDAAVEEDRTHLRDALQAARGGSEAERRVGLFDLRPFDYQEEILERLQEARVTHNQSRNLVVAATGTGKTIVSAFDYRRYVESRRREAPNSRCRLLFVAHRREILEQSLWTFRNVLHDANFGHLLAGGETPDNLDHLFSTIQSLNSRALISLLPPDFYDFIVVDEIHHSAAGSYKALFDHFTPRVFLGLTATPERADCQDILQYCGGRITAEIRLPEAVQRRLLAPFQYFGVTDHVSMDLSGLTWKRGGYDDAELDRIVTGNDLRAGLVLDAMHRYLADPGKVRALCFCVSQAHARYMAGFFNAKGLPSVALDAESPDEVRSDVQRQLVEREINVICVVDLYNEGVDIPQVDTVLFLRPTESLTVFLQQLGRGLRLHPDKDCLTVLDFIGTAHRHFRYGDRYRALLGRTHNPVDDEVEAGFPHLPAGCSIQFERVARERVLENVRQAVLRARTQIVNALQQWRHQTEKELTLSNFVQFHRMDLADIYRNSSWSRLLVRAGLRSEFTEPDEEEITKGMHTLLRTTGSSLLDVSKRVVGQPSLTAAQLSENERALLLALHYDFWKKPGATLGMANLDDSLARLRKNPTLLAELSEAISIKEDDVHYVRQPVDLPFPCPLELHARYTRDQILAALGHYSFEARPEQREGVRYLDRLKTELLFVTLNKTEGEFSPTTLYEDYAISRTRFHWQSQNATAPESVAGQRYIHHEAMGVTILLFVRSDKGKKGSTTPFEFLGPARYISHEGSRPMSIIWDLTHPISARLWMEISRLG